MALPEHPSTGPGRSMAGKDVSKVEAAARGHGSAGPDHRQRQLARSAVRAMAVRTGRSEEEVVTALGATVLATAFVDFVRAVDFVLELRPVHHGRPRRT